MTLAHLVIAMALAITATPASSEDTTSIEWSQLPDPSAQNFDDPYRDLAPEQMSDLMLLVRLRNELGVEELATEERGQLEARKSELEAALRADGIDIEWLLAQRWVVAERRRLAAVATNDALDGQAVEIAGFLILAPPTEKGEQTAYLLPDRGVCNHLPPPPPNQLVRLQMKDIPEIIGPCVPAVARGTLRTEETQHEVVVIEHSVEMWSAWTLQADAVRAMDSSRSDKASQR